MDRPTAPTLLTAAFAAALLLLVAAPAAADWPQILGPERAGVTAGDAHRHGWSEDGPRELWRRPIGAGFSAVAAVGDRLYTLDAPGDTEDAVCLDAATGEELWRTPLGKRFPSEFGDGPRATPTVVGDTVYAVTATVQLAALDAADGAVRWRRDLIEAFDVKQPRFGYSCSPLVDGDLLLLDVGGDEGRGVVAFDRRTGETRWTALEGPGGHSSPIAVELGGRRQYVFNRREGPEMVAVAPGGKVLWRHPSAPDTIMMPVFVPPDRFFISSAAMGDGGIMVEVDAEGGDFTATEVWRQRLMRNHFNNPVLVGGHLYGFDNSTFRCVDAKTGELRWAVRGFGKGSVVAAGDLLYVLGDSGTLAQVVATPKEYRELGRVQAMEGRSWTPPTLDGDRIYLRDHDEMVAYDAGAGDFESITDVAETEPASAPTADRAGDAAEAPKPKPGSAEAVVARYVAARGGLERWREVDALELRGIYATFSHRNPFTLVRQRGDRSGDLYRFDFNVLGEEVTMARDADGPWLHITMLGAPEPSRLPGEIEVYRPQLHREATFGPALLGYREKGIGVKLLGPGEVDGRPTLDLEVTFPDGWQETWMLDAETHLEVAIDATIYDYTQMTDPLTRRTFFSDFREVEGLVIPHRVAHEFGARLEEMEVEEVIVNPEIPAGTFEMPESAPAPESTEAVTEEPAESPAKGAAGG
jgi:outer membrane protein assembly factor BamB